jgi:hypothetical protein
MRRGRSECGQTTVEYVIVAAGVLLPLTFALVFTAELLWVWHSVVEFTRDGARYAATHCWMGSGENVMQYMRTHVPPMVDMEQFQNGEAEIEVKYYSRDAESGTLNEFSCEGAECSTLCVPHTLTVRVRNYEFRKFMNYLGLPAVPIPDFQTSQPVESAGCDAEQGTCVP